jgi:hypothetical protein
VEPERPPLTDNAAAGKATNLDADKLDGNDSAAFLQSSTPSYEVRNSSTGTEGFSTGVSVGCDQGDKILGGGFDGLDPGHGVIVFDATAPGGSNHGVRWANLANPDAGTAGDTVTAKAVCADFPPLRPPDETPR